MFYKWNGSIIAGLMVLSVACSNSEQEQQEDAEAVKVFVAEATSEVQNEVRTYTGTIKAETTSRIATKIMGRIEHLPWQEGDFVKKNDVLFRVENGELRARRSSTASSLNHAQAHLENTQINHDRIINLYKKGSATEKERDDMEAALKSAKAQVASLESALVEIDRMLAQSVIRAPYAGYLTQKFMQHGDMTAPGQPVVALESLDQLKVDARIPESEVGLLSVSDTVSVYVKAAGATVPGIIRQINPSSQFSRTHYQATVLLQTPDSLTSSIKPGMFAQVNYLMKGTPRLMVPEEVLVHRGQLTGLYTINGQNRAVLRWVRTGASVDGRVEILSGLREGEKYITRYPGKLSTGRPVDIRYSN